MKYVPPYGLDPNGDAPYINGNPTIGQQGSIPPAGAFEYPMRELQNFITDTGQTPSNGDLHQISRGVQNGLVSFSVDAGTKNAMVAALNPTPLALTLGMQVRVKKIGQANDGPVTLNIGLGVNSVTRANGSALGIGELPASTVVAMIWDGSQWQVENFQAVTSSSISNVYNTVDIPYAVDTGTTNNIIAAFTPAITALAAGNMFKVRLANAITGASTIKINALAALPLVRPDGSPCQGGEGAVGQEMILIYDGTAIQFSSANYASASQLACSSLNLAGSAPGGTRTATWTVDELIAKSMLGGVSYSGANLTLNFNGGTVGPGGMDVGTTPSSADLHIYAIYNPTTATWNTLGTISYHGPLYGGALPGGYKGSALIWSGKTDVSGNVTAFQQRQRDIVVADTMIFNLGSTGAVSLTAQTLSVVVPINAKTATGWLFAGSYGGGTVPKVASTAAGFGEVWGSGSAGLINNYQPTTIWTDVLLITPQTIFWATGSSTTGGSTMMWCSRYSI
jgi:hypothetical protein